VGGARVLATVVAKAGERVRELAAACDGELSVDAVEVHLGGPGGDEQRLGDLAVGEAFGGEPGDAQLRGCERVAAGDRVASWFCAREDQFFTRLGGDPPRAQIVGEIQGALELGARLDAPAGAP
jgi:hypothetical protein